MSLPCTVFWDIAIYWSKITDLNLPHFYSAPLLGDPRWNFAEITGISKLESIGYRTALLAWSFWYNTGVWQTGRWTGGQTDGHDDSIYGARTASCGKNQRTHVWRRAADDVTVLSGDVTWHRALQMKKHRYRHRHKLKPTSHLRFVAQLYRAIKLRDKVARQYRRCDIGLNVRCIYRPLLWFR